MGFIMRVENAKELGCAVRTARKERHLSQRELAERCGCSQRLVSEVERGKQTAEVGKVLSLLSGLGLALTVQSVDPAGDGRESVARVARAVSERLEQRGRIRTSLADYL